MSNFTSLPIIKGRGAQINTPNKFHNDVRSLDPNVFDEEDFSIKTQTIEIKAKTIVNKVGSPDVGMMYSLNPYQGCEHGCVYCYARNTHTYWGYSAGIDFETKIMVKTNAVQLLRKKLSSKNWEAAPISLSGNTDCYQPIERKYEITRSLLKTFVDYGHPVGIVTKNSLILRDLDLLKELNKYDLVRVAISINTLSEDIRSFLEPRTATIKNRLKVVKELSKHNIPVVVLAAPIVPGLTDHDVLNLAKACAEAGADTIHHIIVRLNGDIARIFKDWVERAFPNRAAKIISQISSLHKGKLNDSEFGHRMRGSGSYADIISQQFSIARKKYFGERKKRGINTERYYQLKNPQLKLF